MLIDVVQTQSKFEALLDRMRDGDDITRDDIPVERLVTVEAEARVPKQKVRLGGLQQVDLGFSADFHSPLMDEDLLGRADSFA